MSGGHFPIEKFRLKSKQFVKFFIEAHREEKKFQYESGSKVRNKIKCGVDYVLLFSNSFAL